MKFNELVIKMNSLVEWSISLGYYDNAGRMRFLNKSVFDLFRMWKSGSDWPTSYPENGDYVYGVIFGCINGKSYIVDCDGDLDPLTFGDLMMALDKKF